MMPKAGGKTKDDEAKGTLGTAKRSGAFFG